MLQTGKIYSDRKRAGVGPVSFRFRYCYSAGPITISFTKRLKSKKQRKRGKRANTQQAPTVLSRKLTVNRIIIDRCSFLPASELGKVTCYCCFHWLSAHFFSFPKKKNPGNQLIIPNGDRRGGFVALVIPRLNFSLSGKYRVVAFCQRRRS